jgi:hypothetical protein
LPVLQCRPTERDTDRRTDEVSVSQLLSGSHVAIVPQDLDASRSTLCVQIGCDAG